MNILENYNISLKNIKEKKTFDFNLTNDFFSAVESAEINIGNIDVILTVTKKALFFEFLFHLKGNIQIACDRCLELMSLPIKVDKTFTVKLGEEYCDEGDDIIIASNQSEEINIAWLLYEMIALEIPIQHKHSDGECEKAMSDILQNCLVDANNALKKENKETTDPRWDKLKNILDNN